MTTPSADLQRLHHDSGLVELLYLDATALGGSEYGFTNHANPDGGPLVFQGASYYPLPFKSEGFDFSSTGNPSKPKLTVSNVSKAFLLDVVSLGDLVGATVYRARTYAKYLDAASFTRRNLLNYSERLNLSSWTVTRATVGPNVVAAPDGLMTAEKAIEDTQTGAHHIYTSSSQLTSVGDDSVVTASIFVKFAERTRISLSLYCRDGSYVGAIYDNTLGLISVPVGYTTTSKDVGDGWLRVSITGSVKAGVNTPRMHVFLFNDVNSSSYTGDGTSGLYLWGGQVELGTTMTAYQFTELDHQPYADPAKLIGPEIYTIEQKTAHNNEFIQWQLTSILDRFGMRLPRRQILKDKGFPGVSRSRVVG